MYAIASSHSGLQAGNIASRALVGQVPGGGAVSAARASVAPSIPTRAIDLGSLPGQRSRDRLLPARHKRKGTDASSCPPHLLPCILRANAGSTNSGVLNRRLAPCCSVREWRSRGSTSHLNPGSAISGGVRTCRCWCKVPLLSSRSEEHTSEL